MSTCESAEDILLKANTEFLDKNFKSALEQYNLSIELDDKVSDAFVKRALCLEKLKRFADALADTNKAISLDPMSFKAYYQKGVVCFELGNQQEAHEAFQKCLAIDRKDSIIPAWIEKCKSSSSSSSKPAAPKPTASKPATEPAKSSSSSSTTSTSSSSSSASAPRPPQPARPPAPMAPKAPRAPKVTGQTAPKPTPAPAPTPEPASTEPAHPVPPPTAQRYTWFQNDNFVIVTIFVKGAKQENVSIDFEQQSLGVDIQLSSDNQFLLDLELAHEIDSAQSKYEIMSTKIEIKLKKAQPMKWDTIERKEELAPPPKKQNKNWDKILAGEEEDKDTGFNQLMRDMYSGASEEERRAMMKSFHESGGTVLSCDWKDVSKAHVDPKPPAGVTRWEKDAV